MTHGTQFSLLEGMFQLFIANNYLNKNKISKIGADLQTVFCSVNDSFDIKNDCLYLLDTQYKLALKRFGHNCFCKLSHMQW